MAVESASHALRPHLWPQRLFPQAPGAGMMEQLGEGAGRQNRLVIAEFVCVFLGCFQGGVRLLGVGATTHSQVKSTLT